MIHIWGNKTAHIAGQGAENSVQPVGIAVEVVHIPHDTDGGPHQLGADWHRLGGLLHRVAGAVVVLVVPVGDFGGIAGERLSAAQAGGKEGVSQRGVAEIDLLA